MEKLIYEAIGVMPIVLQVWPEDIFMYSGIAVIFAFLYATVAAKEAASFLEIRIWTRWRRVMCTEAIQFFKWVAIWSIAPLALALSASYVVLDSRRGAGPDIPLNREWTEIPGGHSCWDDAPCLPGEGVCNILTGRCVYTGDGRCSPFAISVDRGEKLRWENWSEEKGIYRTRSTGRWDWSKNSNTCSVAVKWYRKECRCWNHRGQSPCGLVDPRKESDPNAPYAMGCTGEQAGDAPARDPLAETAGKLKDFVYGDVLAPIVSFPVFPFEERLEESISLDIERAKARLAENNGKKKKGRVR